MMTHFDTYRAIEHMTKAGLDEEAAKSIVDIINLKNDSLATKEDLRYEISELRSELKLDIAVVKKDIEHMKENMATKTDIAIMQNNMIKWLVGLFITLMIAIIGLAFK